MNISTLLEGDSLTRLREIPSESVHCVVTSPPYFNLRDYGIDGQIGLEESPSLYIGNLIKVFAEVRRSLRYDGVVFLNLGDSYAANRTYQVSQSKHKSHDFGKSNASKIPDGLKSKDLLMIPARVAIALQSDGWYLRSQIVWHKPNPMPESIKDRPTSAWESVFMFTKSERYFYDAEAVREAAVTPAGTKGAKGSKERFETPGVNSRPPQYAIYDGTRNCRNVWSINPRPFKGAHFATMPVELAERCIKAGTSEKGCCAICGAPYKRITSRIAEQPQCENSELDRFGTGDAGIHRKIGGQYNEWLAAHPKQTTGWEPTCGHPMGDPVPCVVLDPFAGAGTTNLTAAKLGRDSIGIELNPAYIEIARTRLAGYADVI